MKTLKRLFLLGGSDTIFDIVAEEFVPAAGGIGAKIVLLLSGENWWRDVVPHFTYPWRKRGVTWYHAIAPDENGDLNMDELITKLHEASGIFIGGGHTPTYQRLYATDPIRRIIRERYEEGVALAGLSAGALLAPDICAIPPEDTGDASVRIAEGLGLIKDIIVGVHFSEWNTLPHVLDSLVKTETTYALGIDETACAILEDGRLKKTLGRSVYEITMTDFAARTYKKREYLE